MQPQALINFVLSKALVNVNFDETFNSSLLSQKEEKFTIDKTLARGIYLNDPNKIVANSIESVPNYEQQFDPVTEMEKVVFDMRKKYDVARTASLNVTEDISKMTKQKELLEQQISKLTNDTGNLKTELNKVEKNIETTTALMQDSIFKRDIRFHLVQRLKQDILYYKKKIFDLNVGMVRHNTTLNSLIGESQNKMKFSHRCKVILKSIEHTVLEKEADRAQKLNYCVDRLTKKNNHLQLSQSRQLHLQRSMQSALTEKLPQEKILIKLCLANEFLKKMLKGKMQKEMAKYQPIEGAFNQIKQNTSVKQAQEMISRFIEKDRIYGQLTSSISAAEQKVAAEKEKHEVLKAENRKLMEERELLEERERDIRSKNQKKETKYLDRYDNSLQFIDKIKHLIYQWCVRVQANLNDTPVEKVRKMYSKSNDLSLLKESLKSIDKFLDGLNKLENPEVKIETALMNAKPEVSTVLKGDSYRRNMRIKTEDTIMRNEEDAEDAQLAHDNISEMDFLQQNRKSVKRQYYGNRIRIYSRIN